MRKILTLLIATVFCSSIVVCAQNTGAEQSASAPKKQKSQKIITGFSGGMMLHLGYAFAASPDELFRNASLKDVTQVQNLPSDGVTMGLGGALRMSMINHIHLGVEGGMSFMPLMKSGSNIRLGYGGVLCDYYFRPDKKVRPLLGMVIGGGSYKRLYVPTNEEIVTSDVTTMDYNAAYTTTGFFLLDPYLGMEISIGKRSSVLIRIDYMLPFGTKGSTLSSETLSWSNFITPNGPRLYVGLMFGH